MDNFTFATPMLINFTLTTLAANASNSTSKITGNKFAQKPTGGVASFTIFIFVLNGIIALIGLIGNTSVCVIIFKGKRMRTIANFFLMNLAIADILVLSMCYPLWIIDGIGVKWYLGEAMCKILPSLTDSFYGVSMGCITAIAIYRYFMILHPMHTQLTFRRARVIIVIIWIVSISVICAPLFPVKKYLHGRCGSVWPDEEYRKVYQIVQISWYVIPMMIILVTYIRIRMYLNKKMRYEWMNTRRPSVYDTGLASHVLGIKKALQLLAPVVVAYAILVFPWNMVRLISLLPQSVYYELTETGKPTVLKDWFNYLMQFSATILMANSSCNPFIYYLVSKDFRGEFKKGFRAIKKFFKIKSQRTQMVSIPTQMLSMSLPTQMMSVSIPSPDKSPAVSIRSHTQVELMVFIDEEALLVMPERETIL